METQQILGDYKLFVRTLLTNLSLADIGVDGYQFDHLCYRVASAGEYHAIRAKLMPLSSELATTIHNGREFSIFKLKQPLMIDGHSIPLIELPMPAADKPYATGIEHAEVVVLPGFEEFCEVHKSQFTKQPNLDSIYATASITFANGATVKFHALSLAQTVVLQGGEYEPIDCNKA